MSRRQCYRQMASRPCSSASAISGGGGVTVVLILHKIREVLAVADTVSVLRGGRLVAGPFPRGEADQESVAEMIVGSDSPAIGSARGNGAVVGAAGFRGASAQHPRKETAKEGREAAVLQLNGLHTPESPDEPALDGVSLTIRPGEIVGVAGVQGNGQRTLVEAIAGLTDIAGGQIRLGGSAATGAGPANRRELGLRVIPFERNSEGLSLASALWENWSVRELLRMPLFSLVHPSRLQRRCDEALRTWNVRFAGTTQHAATLSGGNAQKVILAREIDAQARLIIAAQPARGLDIGATTFVWSALRAAAARGCGILLISTDLDELFDISHRLVVMLSGRIVAGFEPPFDIDAVGRAMTGASR